MPRIQIAVEDAIELAELLGFLRDWLDTDPTAAAALNHFGGSVSTAADMRTDLERFAFLLGGNDGEHYLPPNDF
ncbi:hypothetical protein [Nocardia sp. NPDC052566]|uniref:hypothetical protein n=1 Tax=Nocardia sp. NPDC052566 TaxID=3364330 RepID=UPI0037C55D10